MLPFTVSPIIILPLDIESFPSGLTRVSPEKDQLPILPDSALK
jgi:hypothetical protein